jgi:hypothetical protein
MMVGIALFFICVHLLSFLLRVNLLTHRLGGSALAPRCNRLCQGYDSIMPGRFRSAHALVYSAFADFMEMTTRSSLPLNRAFSRV